ncbi:uncharacterized protein E0L32_010594 [Thyridium curvatum]|uniref:Phosphoinositide phospholipase C n=1 Tax=Thyridium curvatum TaxID=1093900 RepID=A0A507AS57_9PEZI|nr:uncharacterized protein E0L32_010594 [Thyridium curvatum]TPX07698.1 hypothetical protein E0L32_010594 [Thyridium curvatum]
MAESGLSSRLAKLNPFTSSRRGDDDEEYGEEVGSGSIAGGGHGSRESEITRSQLRVSHALRSFLVNVGALSEREAALDDPEEQTPAVRELAKLPHIRVPPSVTDRSRPLPEYFVSSSHNTYLMAHQLYGTSAASAYDTTLRAGARCIEIDAWDNSENADEPKVTHGYTLVSHIPFRAVCETIRDVVDKEAAEAVDAQGYRAAPILVSLENHCKPEGQLRLVQIMRETWGDRLLSRHVREKGHEEEHGTGEHVTLDELGSKIAVIVEYHIPNELRQDDGTSSVSSSDAEDEEAEKARREYKAQKEAAESAVIIPELAELGVYAQSVKPGDDSWYAQAKMTNGPHHHLINLSESGLSGLLPTHAEKISNHNAHHLMRVYPKGTRISSKNLNPVPFWAVGAHVCALNWQTFNASMQLNEALFSGSDGYVLKPAELRAGGSGALSGQRKRLRLHVAGASSVPLPAGREADDIKPYLTCTLVHPKMLDGEDYSNISAMKRKTSPYRHHNFSGFLHRGENPPATDPVWDETLEWDYEDSELVFLRLLVKSDDSFARNPKFAVAAVRLMYTQPEWRFIRMLDLKGRETKCSLLVKFEIQDAPRHVVLGS